MQEPLVNSAGNSRTTGRSKVWTMVAVGTFGLALATFFILRHAGITNSANPQMSSVKRNSANSGKCTSSGEEEVVVHLGRGSVRGTQTEWYGRRFRGIPYGQAKRWHNAEPAKEITGEFDAREFSASCIRGKSHFNEPMSEDCLHLNIYTPIPVKKDVGLTIPTLVWLHGGSFTMGAGSDFHVEDVQELVTTRRLIVVTVNYRLGIFGFLGSERLRHTPSSSVGNFGTLDQQLALKWINDNIAHFGGDPRRISLVGWSAGAASISAHLSMPTSEGLFNRAIMMSGAFVNWAAQSMEDAESDYDNVLAVTGCDQSQQCLNHGPPCDCLLKMTVEELLDAQSKVAATWAPTVDTTHLPKHPQEALAAGECHKNKHVIMGGTMEDCLKDIGANATESDFEQFLVMKQGGGMGLPDSMVQEAKQLYLKNLRAPTQNGLDRWSPAYWAARRAGADQSMNCMARRAAKQWKEKTGGRAYYYVWSNEPSDRYDDPAHEDPNAPFSVKGCWTCPGATHGIDQKYLFRTDSKVNLDDDTSDLADMYQTFVSNLIRGEDPNTWKSMTLSRWDETTQTLKRAWENINKGGMNFKAGNVRLEPDLKSNECDFWDRFEAQKVAN